MSANRSVSADRRAVLKTMGVGALGVAAAPLLAACTGDTTPVGSTGPVTAPSGSLLPVPPGKVEPILDRQKVDAALTWLDGYAQAAMDSTGLPGMAITVVYQDAVLYAKGFGVREVDKPDKVGPDTVFQLASVSKPLASTVVAAVVGRKAMTWTDPIISHSPNFSLKDEFVTQNASSADLMSHQGGLKTGAGDLLEDLGFDRAYIFARLNQQPLDPFRASYNYSNFGFTWGGQAAADAMKMSWEDLADEVLFKPLGMTSTSYRYADYEKREDRAIIHVPLGDKKWEAKYRRTPDAEAPAGGASSSVRDLAQWLRLQLGNGAYEGKPVVDAEALQTSHVPHAISRPAQDPAARSGAYGLGWNVSSDDLGRVVLGHSGAFNLGVATAVSMLPGEGLAIVAVTNGRPQGIPEAITAAFLDTLQHGSPTVDWLTFTNGVFKQIDAADAPAADYTKAPASPAPAQSLSSYAGRYSSSYYGPLVVAQANGVLSMTMGPSAAPTTFPLTHFDGDTFSFDSIGENANGLAGAIFAAPSGGSAPSVRLDFYDRTGLGTFSREG